MRKEKLFIRYIFFRHQVNIKMIYYNFLLPSDWQKDSKKHSVIEF